MTEECTLHTALHRKCTSKLWSITCHV